MDVSNHEYCATRSARFVRIAVACLALVVAGATRAGTQAPSVASERLSQYVHESWQTRDGLPQNSVYALAQTPDGYLWLGTMGGLVRFDGVRFTLFNSANTPALRTNDVRTLFVDRAGTLWVGTYGGGTSSYRDGRFSA
ncbi:MAG: hypothetical protein H0W68_01175, partial [Gemmatimonadaceae bacterium]|nr:hypothetical protein [Gemmatimonadaceae bacterium]